MSTVLKKEPLLPRKDRNLHPHRLLLRPLQQISLKKMVMVIPAWETPGTLHLRKPSRALESTLPWRYRQLLRVLSYFVLLHQYPKASQKARESEENGGIKTDISVTYITFASTVFFLCLFYLSYFFAFYCFLCCRQYPRAQVPLS